MLNKDAFAGQWKQIRGQVQQWWGRLTDNDLERVDGKWEQFVGVLQEKYGYTREVTEGEFKERMAQFEGRQRQKKLASQASALDIAEDTWKQMHSQARVWWDKLTDDELDGTGGKANAVFALLQAEYGYSRERAEAEFKRRVREYEASLKNSASPDALFSHIEIPGLFS